MGIKSAGWNGRNGWNWVKWKLGQIGTPFLWENLEFSKTENTEYCALWIKTDCLNHCVLKFVFLHCHLTFSNSQLTDICRLLSAKIEFMIEQSGLLPEQQIRLKKCWHCSGSCLIQRHWLNSTLPASLSFKYISHIHILFDFTSQRNNRNSLGVAFPFTLPAWPRARVGIQPGGVVWRWPFVG